MKRRSPMPPRRTRLTRTTGLARTPWPVTAEQVQRWRTTQDESRKRYAAKPKRQRDTGPSRKTRRSLAGRSGGICEFPACWRQAVHDHHRGARGMGGTRNPEINALSAQLHYCADHHAYVEANPAESYRNGWKVRRGEVACLVPVLTRHHPAPVLLDDHGGWKPATTSPAGEAA